MLYLASTELAISSTTQHTMMGELPALSSPSRSPELLMKLLVPLKLSTVLSDVKIAPPPCVAELLTKLLIPLNLSSVLLNALIAPASDLETLFCVKLFPDRVTLALITTSAVPSLSLKEQLTSLAYCVDCKSRAHRQ